MRWPRLPREAELGLLGASAVCFALTWLAAFSYIGFGSWLAGLALDAVVLLFARTRGMTVAAAVLLLFGSGGAFVVGNAVAQVIGA